MVIFEELDQLIENYETSLLNLLDGEIQKPNVIFVATTNFIDKIPTRIRRPGRFSSVIHVDFPTAITRHFYLTKKIGHSLELDGWVEKTKNFSIDELKETVLAVKCLGYNLDTIIDRIRTNKGMLPEEMPSCNNEHNRDCDDNDCYGCNSDDPKDSPF